MCIRDRSITELFSWLTSEQGLMALLAQNWVLGTCIIAAIVFIETGLVVMPFLPGDSLLFAAGAFLGLAGIDPIVSLAAITFAAIAGDALNYAIASSRWGQKLAHSRWVKPDHLERARDYFARYGAMTITVARDVYKRQQVNSPGSSTAQGRRGDSVAAMYST